MEEIRNGTIEIKIQDGIPIYINRGIQSISVSEKAKNLKKIS
jgi:hypothetical protein